MPADRVGGRAFGRVVGCVCVLGGDVVPGPFGDGPGQFLHEQGHPVGALDLLPAGTAEKLKALLDVLDPYGVKELVQSGVVAIGRGQRSITDRSLRTA